MVGSAIFDHDESLVAELAILFVVPYSQTEREGSAPLVCGPPRDPKHAPRARSLSRGRRL
jgi:hypothetical protein